MFTAAEPDFFIGFQDELDGGESGAFMASVAEGLLLAAAAGTPPVRSCF